MKNKIIYITVLVLIVITAGYLYSRYSIDKKREAKFDLNSLSYTLPTHNMICLPNIKFICNPQSKCYQVKPTVFILFDGLLDTFYRCDNQPCDSYEVRTDTSGDYTNFTPIVPNGTIWKVNKNGNYVEVATIGAETYISYGKCK